MRITIVIAGLGGGGAERVCVNLANAWVERRHHVTILTVNQNSAPAYAIDPRVERADIGWPRWATNEELNSAAIAPIIRGLHDAGCAKQLMEQITILALLRHAILARKPDVVISHIDVTNVLVLAALAAANVPVIVCEHTDNTRISLGSWQNVRAALYRRARAVVASHPNSAAWLEGHGARAYTIPNPLITPPPRSHDRNGSRLRLVTLTRLSEEKRPGWFVHAFASIAKNFPEWDFDVYGDGPLHSSIANLVGSVAPKRIQLRGFTDAPYDVLNEADLFVSTSWVEGFGNSIWESLACGVPVVAMDAGAPVRSLVRDGVDGLIVNENYVDALASALASLMGDNERRKAFAVRAPEVLTRFPLEAALHSWDQLLAEVTGG